MGSDGLHGSAGVVVSVGGSRVPQEGPLATFGTYCAPWYIVVQRSCGMRGQAAEAPLEAVCMSMRHTPERATEPGVV